MEARKIIFLDCDGVINSIQWEAVRKEMPKESVVDDAIDPRCCSSQSFYVMLGAGMFSLSGYRVLNEASML